ncbi:response regulator transcription factor [Maridesulfovibrio sp.]|uniref:response regulator transcription factor n=1 Tax=Maridesulfovibrio sp. TaxID=2795000 RepID=UPI0029CA08BC|nr:response regulator transcription factor [Maridesulfovibrio sp.]
MFERKSRELPPFGIVLINSHPLYCEGVKAKLKREQNYFIAALAASGEEGLACVRDTSPSFVIVDSDLPDIDSTVLVRELVCRNENVLVLMTGENVQVGNVAEAFEAGASGFVGKMSKPCELVRAMDTVLRGNLYLDDAISHGIKRDFSICKKVRRNLFCNSLTPREHEVMQHLATGLTVQDIAAELFVSPRTVENHRSNLMRKLGVKTPLGFIRFAYRHGLIDLDEN